MTDRRDPQHLRSRGDRAAARPLVDYPQTIDKEVITKRIG